MEFEMKHKLDKGKNVNPVSNDKLITLNMEIENFFQIFGLKETRLKQ